jgi:hypothetical protein
MCLQSMQKASKHIIAPSVSSNTPLLSLCESIFFQNVHFTAVSFLRNLSKNILTF